MGMTKRLLQSIPEPKQQCIDAIRHCINYAQVSISSETGLNEKKRVAATTALDDALQKLDILEEQINRPSYNEAA